MDQVFTDGVECKSKIIDSIKSASKSIKVAMAFFTDREIADILIQSRNRNIEVVVILSTDKNNEKIKSVLFPHCKVYTHAANGRGIMHHKFCIIDESLLLHGSYNYTYNALNNNEESLNISDSYSLIKDYSTIFNNLLDNSIIVNSKTPEFVETEIKVEEKEDYLEKFSNELKNHISQIFDEFNVDEIIKTGQSLSKSSDGSEAVFKNHLNSVLSEANTKLNKDDTVKDLVKIKMTNSLDRTIELNTKNLDTELNLLSSYTNSQKGQLQALISDYKDKKLKKQESYNLEENELKKCQLTKTEIIDEIDSLDRQIIVKKFWIFPTYLKLFLSTLFLVYLAVFFGSAIWKIFFEESEIMKLLLRGVTPEAPPLFDANALLKIYTRKGIFFGGVATFFFLIPVMLSSIKMFAPENKFLEYIAGWFLGIFAIDIVVSILISQHTFEIKRLISGSSQQWTLGTALRIR